MPRAPAARPASTPRQSHPPPTGPRRSTRPDLVCHALYTLCNIASGDSSHKDALCASNAPSLLLHHLKAGAVPTKLAAVWCVINLVTSDELVQRFKDIGVLEQLQALQADADVELAERAKAALESFK